MSRSVLVFLVVATLAGCKGRGSRKAVTRGGRFAYPETRVAEQVDDYHGTRVADPYRWLEDGNSEETKAWIEAQNKLAFSYLRKLRYRERIRDRLEELWDHERFGVPSREGGRLFYAHNDGLQNQSVLYVIDALDAEPRVLIDPNNFSEDGTVALSGRWVSPDGSLMAYAVSSGGSDWRVLRVLDVESGQDLAADRLWWVKFSGARWTPDSRGFYYSRLPEPDPGRELSGVNENVKIYYHRVGTPQDLDRLVYERPDQPGWGLSSWVTEDGRYLGIYVSPRDTSNNGIFYIDLERKGEVVELLKEFDAHYWPVGSVGSTWYFVTDKGAPNRKIVAIDLDQPGEPAWRVLVPEGKYAIQDAYVLGDRLLVHTLRRAQSRLQLFGLEDGAFEREIELPGPGSVYFRRGGPGRQAQRDFYFAFTSFTTPATIYHYDVDTRRLTLFRRPEVAFDPGRFVTEQVAYRGRDGTAITMFLSRKQQKKWKRDGSHPVLLRGYGGFNISSRPSFGISNLVWMEMGGILAVPNLRGGGEYGEAWHKAGMREKKQTVFNDFVAAAEGLIRNGYTNRARLAIGGASNGGLLVAACLVQRPDLFAACLPDRGVLDMLRYDKFTIGHAWVGEYGSSDDPEMFKALYAYSPYHRIRAGVSYPATLITTADRDDRVVPAHSFKFAARLQAAQAGGAPILIRIGTRAGHGAGTPVSKRIDLAADKLAFLAENLGVKVRGRFWRK